MKTLNSLNICPPGGYRYWVPETKQWIPDPSERNGAGHLAMDDFLSELRRHYNANRIPIPPNITDLVQDQICSNLPGGWCNESGVPVHAAHTPGWLLDYTRLKQGTETLLRWVMAGRRYVEQKEANARATVCTNCPQNQAPIGCTSCNMPALMGLINEIRAGRTTPLDQAINACNICGCSLKAKVWLPIDVLRKSTPAEQMNAFPAHCWMLPANDKS